MVAFQQLHHLVFLDAFIKLSVFVNFSSTDHFAPKLVQLFGHSIVLVQQLLLILLKLINELLFLVMVPFELLHYLLV